MKSEDMITLGDRVRDTITGFVGVAVGKTYWINGCIRVTVQPQELKDGKPIDPMGFDVEQLEVVETKAHPVGKRSGGPMPEVKRL